MTSDEVLALLGRRYRGETSGNGPAWAFVPQVRNAAGFAATRTADAIAMALWPSRGLELHGFEIKVSRADWLRELKKPDKAETFIALCDRWWIAAGDATVVNPAELPAGWGLLVAQKNRIAQKVAAELLPPIGEAPFSAAGKSFLAALLRSAARTHAVTPEEVRAASAAAIESHREYAAQRLAERDKTIEILRGRLDAFKATFGVALGDADGVWGGKPAAEVGAALRLVLDGEADVARFEQRLRSLADSAERLAADLRGALGG